MAEGLLAELGAGNYRETADKLRRVAVDTLSPENRADLLMIAESFDRLARKEGDGTTLSRCSGPNPHAARPLRKVA